MMRIGSGMLWPRDRKPGSDEMDSLRKAVSLRFIDGDMAIFGVPSDFSELLPLKLDVPHNTTSMILFIWPWMRYHPISAVMIQSKHIQSGRQILSSLKHAPSFVRIFDDFEAKL
jgi:hypothetical protein